MINSNSSSISNREREGRSKGNADYQKVATHLLSFSVGTLVVPIVFFKDIFGIKLEYNQNIYSIIRTQETWYQIVCFAVFFSLSISIISSINYINYSGYYIRQLYRNQNCISWLQSDEGKKITKILGWLYRFTWVGFGVGFIGMMILFLFFTKPKL